MMMVAKSQTEYICLMTNGLDIIDGGLLPLNDDDTAGDALHHPSKIMEVRPAFMEPLPPGRGGPPSRQRGIIVNNDSGAVRMRRSSSSSSSFPLKDDAGYIGYLSDDESGGDASDVMMKVLSRRRRELMGSDISFSGCMFMMIAACGLLMLFLFAASPWGVPPPRRL